MRKPLASLSTKYECVVSSHMAADFASSPPQLLHAVDLREQLERTLPGGRQRCLITIELKT